MMYLAVFIALVAFGTSSAQLHGPICHSNHLQHTEDEVIEMVVNQMDTDADGILSNEEALVFFADLIGVHLGSLAHLLASMSDQELLDIAMGFRIERETFTDAWHDRFHDNKDFIRYVFDTFDISDDGSLSGTELEGVINLALEHGDENRDRVLEKEELVTFLETLYKNC